MTSRGEKMRKFITFACSFLLLLTFSTIAFADYVPPRPPVYNNCPVPNLTQAHSTWYFDKVHGSDTTGDGSQANPWQNPQTIFTANGSVGPFYTAVNPTSGVIHPGDVTLLNDGNYGTLSIGSTTLTNPSDFLTISNASGQNNVLFTNISIQSFDKLFFNGITVENNGNGSPGSVSDSLISLIDNGRTAQVQNVIFQNMTLAAQADVSSWSSSDWNTKGINGIAAIASGTSGANINCVSLNKNHIFNVIGGIQLFASSSLIQGNNISMTGDYAVDTCGTYIKVNNNVMYDGNSVGGDIAPTTSLNNCSQVEVFNNIIMRQISSTATPFPPIFYDGISNFDSDITNLNIHNNLVITDAPYGIGGSSLHNSTITNNTIIQDGTSSSNGLPILWVGPMSTTGTNSSNVTVSKNFVPQLGNSTTPFYNIGTSVKASSNLFPYSGNGVIYDYDASSNPEVLSGNSGSSTNYTQALSGGVNTVDKSGGYTNQIQGYSPLVQQYNMRPKAGSTLANGIGANGFGNINSSIFAYTGSSGAIVNNDPTVNIIPAYNDSYANWKNAGLQSVGGIPSRTTVCANVSPTGKTPPVANDDASVINAAIAGCPAGEVVQLASGTFQLDQSEYISLNKGITLRGTNTLNPSSPYWKTVINVYNGAIPDWTISSTTAGANCGVTSASVATCSAATGVILMSPSNNYNWGWAGCNFGSTPTGCGATLAVDASQGQTKIQVSSTSNFSVGMWVLIDENPQVVSTANPIPGQANVLASSDFLSSSGSPVTMRLEGGDEPTSYSFSPNRLNAEIHLIKAIGAGPCPGVNCTLTFDDPLTMAFRQSGNHDARVYWPTVQSSASTPNPFLQYAGVENLTITKAANGGIQSTFCAYCWVKNVEVSGWDGGAFNATYSVRNQVTGNYFHDCYDCENNGAEYLVSTNQASTETLIDNNILLRGGKGMVGRGANTTVTAYNYVDDTFYMQAVIGNYWQDMGVNGSHYAGAHHYLFEGNWGDNCDSDETHGNAIYHTFLRNECTGVRTTFQDPSNAALTVNDTAGTCYTEGAVANPCAPLRAAGPMAFDYWFAFVGNVLGKSGVTTAANGWIYNGTAGGENAVNKAIWISGWADGAWSNKTDKNLSGVTGTWIFRHGNFDYVNNSIADWASGYSHAIPSSFYLTSAPSYFKGTNCNYPWPWVQASAGTVLPNPSGTGCSSTDGLPAKARYDAGTPFTQP